MRQSLFRRKNFKKPFILGQFYCIIKSEECKAIKKGQYYRGKE